MCFFLLKWSRLTWLSHWSTMRVICRELEVVSFNRLLKNYHKGLSGKGAYRRRKSCFALKYINKYNLKIELPSRNGKTQSWAWAPSGIRNTMRLPAHRTLFPQWVGQVWKIFPPLGILHTKSNLFLQWASNASKRMWYCSGRRQESSWKKAV